MELIVYSQTRLFAECLAQGLSGHDAVVACTGLTTFETVVAHLGIAPSSAVIVDLSNDRAWQDVYRLRERYPKQCLLGFAVSDEPDDLIECARIGCNGVIPRETSANRTVAIVRQALRGEVTCSKAAAGGLMRALSNTSRQGLAALPDCLTRRECEICRLVIEGLTNKEIALEVHCSEGTVKNHVHSILSKLDVPRRGALYHHIHARGYQDTPRTRVLDRFSMGGSVPGR